MVTESFLFATFASISSPLVDTLIAPQSRSASPAPPGFASRLTPAIVDVIPRPQPSGILDPLSSILDPPPHDPPHPPPHNPRPPRPHAPPRRRSLPRRTGRRLHAPLRRPVPHRLDRRRQWLHRPRR